MNKSKPPLRLLQLISVFATGLLLSACNAPMQVKSTTHTPLQHETTTIPEHELLDLGVLALDPGLDDLDKDEQESVLPLVRNAEGYYLANQLVKTLQDSGGWGAVRVLPANTVITDVYVEGAILHSDGETLELEIDISDTSGKHWYSKRYKEKASTYAYDRRKSLDRDPFQGLFNRIANDLLDYRRQLDGRQAAQLHNISTLRFARDFNPEAYGGHLGEGSDGQLQIQRLPASNDPVMQRIQGIRERDYLFVDTIQEYYDAFSMQMQSPYQTWRAENYQEVVATRELKRQSRERTIGGIAAILAGIAASGSNSGATRAAGAVAIGSGAALVKSGFAKRAEAKLHVEALAELGQSLEAEVEPRIIQLEDRTVTLSGNVQAQYQQWKQLLREMYRIERGAAP